MRMTANGERGKNWNGEYSRDRRLAFSATTAGSSVVTVGIVGLMVLWTPAFAARIRRFGPFALTLARRLEVAAFIEAFADPARFLLRSTRSFAIGYTSQGQHIATWYVPLRCDHAREGWAHCPSLLYQGRLDGELGGIHEAGQGAEKPWGTLDVSCTLADTEIVIVWTERGGPPVSKPDDAGGFGSKLVTRSMSTQLGGSIDRQWLREGVVATIKISKERLAR